jgi:hypothetical protein
MRYEKCEFLFELHLTEKKIPNCTTFSKKIENTLQFDVCRTCHWGASVHLKDAPMAGQRSYEGRAIGVRASLLLLFFFHFFKFSLEGLRGLGLEGFGLEGFWWFGVLQWFGVLRWFGVWMIFF